MQFTVGWVSCSLQSNGSLTLGAWDLILLLLFYLQTRKYFVRNFKCLPKFTIGSYYREKSGERKKKSTPGPTGLQAGYAPSLFCSFAAKRDEYNDFARFTNYETNPSYNKSGSCILLEY